MEENKEDLNKVNMNLTELLCDPTLLQAAYDKIKRNPNTKGSDNVTLDGITLQWFEKIASDIATGRYSFQPSRR